MIGVPYLTGVRLALSPLVVQRPGAIAATDVLLLDVLLLALQIQLGRNRELHVAGVACQELLLGVIVSRQRRPSASSSSSFSLSDFSGPKPLIQVQLLDV